MRQAMRFILGTWDPRSPGEIEHDIDDEMSFHLDMLRRRLREEGLSEEAARAEAARRFGDVDEYRRQCRDVALKERIMLQRINLVLLVVMAAVVGFTAWQSWAQQSKVNTTLERLTERIEAMSAKAAADDSPMPADRRPAPGKAASTAPSGAPAGSLNVVTVACDGDLLKAGAYALPQGGLSLRRLLTASGWDGKREIDVVLKRANFNGGYTQFLIRRKVLLDSTARDIPLVGGDIVQVETDAAKLPKELLNLDSTPPQTLTPDKFGRVAEHRAGAAALNNVEGNKHLFIGDFDAKAQSLGLSALEAGAKYAMVVGDVERPGLYDLSMVVDANAPLIASLIDRAGPIGRPVDIGLIRRLTNVGSVVHEASWLLPSSLYGGAFSVLQGGEVVVVSNSWRRPGPPRGGVVNAVFVPDSDGGWMPVERLMSLEADAAVREFTDMRRAGTSTTFIDRGPHNVKRWKECVDLVYETGDVRGRFIPGFGGAKREGVTLGELVSRTMADGVSRWDVVIHTHDGRGKLTPGTIVPAKDVMESKAMLKPGDTAVFRASPDR